MKKAALAALILLLGCFPALAWETRPQGSAGYLEKTNLIVSVYVQGCGEWTEDGMAYTRYALETAAGYLEAQGARMGKATRLITAEDDPRLCLHMDSETAYEDSLGDGESFDETAMEYLWEAWPQEQIEEYGADGCAFVFFMPGEGISYSMCYYADDDPYYSGEYCVIYEYDMDTPGKGETVAAYAHELLHLFGAVDLYLPSVDDGVTHELVEYVAETYPDELMYYTYEDDDSSNLTSVTRTLSPVTLYCIGFTEDELLLKRFPTLRRADPAAFATKESGAEDAYFCNDPDCPYCGQEVQNGI